MNVPNWKLERYRLGELSEADTKQVAAALAGDATLRERLAALESDDVATLRAHPPSRVAERVRLTARDAGSLTPKRAPWMMPAFALAAAALVGVVVWQLQPPPSTEDVVTMKGDALRLFRLTNSEPERLEDGARVKPHDVVQVALELEGAKYAVVVSVDGAGGATLHWPHGPDARTPPNFKKLPESFELDEAPGFERFFLITSNEPLSPEQLYAAVKQAGRTGTLSIPAAATQRSLLLQKVVTP